MDDDLTPEQLVTLEEWKVQWKEINTCTCPANRPLAEDATTRAYAEIGLPKPQYLWFDSPLAAVKGMYDYFGGKADKGELLSTFWHFGSADAYWVSYYLFERDVLNKRHDEKDLRLLQIHEDLVRSCFFSMPFEGVCAITERPLEIHLNERFLPHNPVGPFALFRDGVAHYAINGIRIDKAHEYIITDPERITTGAITSEPNAELRRIMLEKFGEARYIQETGAQVIHSDDYGDLYRTVIPGDEDLVMVKVVNSTPEPDGHYKDYWLRVDPVCKTAREAVASTWRRPDGSRVFTPKGYAPAVQT